MKRPDREQVNHEIDRGKKLQVDEPEKRPQSSWTPPTFRDWKVNTYGGQSSYGFCIRGVDGKLVVAGVKWEESGGRGQEVREAKALYYGLQKAAELLPKGIRRVMVESESTLLIWKLQSSAKENSEVGRVIGKIIQLSKFSGEFTICSFHPVEIDGNSLARAMSKFNRAADETEAVWTKDFPKVACNIGASDMKCYSTLCKMGTDAAAGDTNIEAAAASIAYCKMLVFPESSDQPVMSSSDLESQSRNVAESQPSCPDQQTLQSQMNPDTGDGPDADAPPN